jgi:iron complex outermembrane receptor protein
VLKNAVLCGGSALAVAASLWATGAVAATADATDNATSPGMVGELTVVAEKREEAIESVPVAITAFSAKQRDIIGIRTVQELSDFTPGLSYYAISDRAYIRGIGRNSVNLATASGVAVYYNGIYYGANGSISLQHDSLFIGNIEVDRGPQNSLHGSNADGGVINYVEQRPTDSFYAEGRAGVANYGYYYGEAVVSGPINDDWKFRIGGNYSTQTGGYFHNLDGPPEGGSGPQGNGGHWQYLEAQLQGKIGDHLDVWGMVSSGEFDTNFHTVATLGAIPTTPVGEGAEALVPSAFYGLCGLPGFAGSANDIGAGGAHGCSSVAAPGTNGSVVVGSVQGDRVLASSFPGNNPSTADPHSFIETSTQHNTENDNIALATNWTYHLPTMDITYLGGYQSFLYHLVFGPGVDAGVTSFQEQTAGGPVTVNPTADNTLFIEKDQSFSHELDFTSTTSSPLQYIFGAYWYHEHFEQPIGAACRPNQPQIVNPINGPINADGCAYNQDGVITYNDYAAFAHFSYKFNEQWDIAGSLRYTADHKAGYETQRLIAFCTPTCAALPFGFDITAIKSTGAIPGAGPQSILPNGDVFRTLAASWGAVTGDVTIDWTPNPSTLTYFRYARGYKSGGYEAGSFEGAPASGGSPAAAADTSPEFVDSFELGLKKTIGSAFTANAALFYYNFKNDQQPLTVIENTAAGPISVGQIFNLTAARTYGFELEGVWRPVDPLAISLEYSYLNSHVTNMNGVCVVNSSDPFATLPSANVSGCAATAASHPENLVGAELPEAPPNKVALNATYVWKLEPGNLTVSASYIWKDKTYGSIFNDPLNLAPAYYTLNFRATYDDAQGRYTLIAFANNVTNTLGYDNVTETRVAGGTAGVPPVLVQGTGLTAPFTFGVEVQVRFK